MKVKHNGKVTEKTLDNIRASLIKRNKNLPPTKALKITNMVWCDAIK